MLIAYELATEKEEFLPWSAFTDLPIKIHSLLIFLHFMPNSDKIEVKICANLEYVNMYYNFQFVVSLSNFINITKGPTAHKDFSVIIINMTIELSTKPGCWPKNHRNLNDAHCKIKCGQFDNFFT
jgi:hypothetical protein